MNVSIKKTYILVTLLVVIFLQSCGSSSYKAAPLNQNHAILITPKLPIINLKMTPIPIINISKINGINTGIKRKFTNEFIIPTGLNSISIKASQSDRRSVKESFSNLKFIAKNNERYKVSVNFGSTYADFLISDSKGSIVAISKELKAEIPHIIFTPVRR